MATGKEKRERKHRVSYTLFKGTSLVAYLPLFLFSFKDLLILFDVSVSVCMCLWMQKPELADPLEPELHMAVSLPVWKLGTEFRASGRGVNTLDC